MSAGAFAATLAYAGVAGPFGRFGVSCTASGVRSIFLPGAPVVEQRPGDLPPAAAGEVLARTVTELAAYFDGTLDRFTVPLDPLGTPFQRLVWDAVLGVPFGETRSYLQIAVALGRPRAARAVGHANGSNPLPVLVPCHRLIGSNGSLTGYAGGLALKRQLLEHEQRVRLASTRAAGTNRTAAALESG